MTRRLIANFLLGFSLFVVSPISSPPVAMAQTQTQESDLEPFKQVELDRSLAIRALDAYVALKGSVPADQFENLFDEGNEEKLVTLVPGFHKILVDNGFADEDRWIEALQSVVIAYEGLQDGTQEENQRALEDLKSDQSLPPEQKQQLILMLQSMIPSENNMSVVKGLMSDPETNNKLSQVVEEM